VEYGVDFNCIRKLQPVGIRKNDFFNLIRASVFPIKFLSKLVCVQISCIQPNKVTNLIGWCWGLVFICCGFIDKLGLGYFVGKELL